MHDDVYKKLCDTIANRGGRYPGGDIPEFYALARELYTPEEAEVSSAMPRGLSPAPVIAAAAGKPEEEVARILEKMADRALLISADRDGTRFYTSPPFVPGIFEFQFMRGTKTERDRKLAKLIHAYKTAYDALNPPAPSSFPQTRVITIDRMVTADNVIHPYDQVAHYIDISDPISVSTCFCRHEAKLIDETDDCGVPDEVCMNFGMAAQFLIDRGIGKRITKEEALDVLKKSEEAGLVHAGSNKQEIDFLCNCCRCHCMILKTAQTFSKPGLFLASGFQPVWDADFCNGCDICIDRCPMSALTSGEENVPVLDLDYCIGCGVCATGCPVEAISLEHRPGTIIPPVNQKALREALKASES